ncbi:Transposon protein [Arachis hypogaea]|nr:Transposon protein [Arachis hypogaea]
MKIEHISNLEDKFLNWIKLSCKNLYTYIEGHWCLDHFEGCVASFKFVCPNQAEILKQHRQLSMSVRCTIENNVEVGVKPSKTYQSFIATAGGHRELSFIEKDVKNYITREVHDISELDDAKEFGKILMLIKEKNHNFFSNLNLRLISQLRLLFGLMQEAELLVSILEMLFQSIPLTIQTDNLLF